MQQNYFICGHTMKWFEWWNQTVYMSGSAGNGKDGIPQNEMNTMIHIKF